MSSGLEDNLKRSMFSQQNTSNLYVDIIKKNNLGLIDSEQKKYLTTRLVQTMKIVFDKIDTRKLTPGNFNKVVSGANDLVLSKMNEMVSKNNVGMMGINRGMEINSGQTKQPMISSEGNILSYNGEIYNFKEIQTQKNFTNTKFNSDTELIFYLLNTIGF
jgi:hypothetical protein